jgi:hypothetical protein
MSAISSKGFALVALVLASAINAPWRAARPSISAGANTAAWQEKGRYVAPAAAVDRLVHHSVILELNLPSYRMEAAKKKKAALAADSSQ